MIRLCLALANRHDAACLTHGTTLHPHEERNNKRERQDDGQEAGEPIGLWCLEVVVDAVLLEKLFVGVAQLHCTCGCELAAISEDTRDDVGGVVDGDVLDVAFLHLHKEFLVAELFACWLRNELATECQHHDCANNCPDGPLGHGGLPLGAWLLVTHPLQRIALRLVAWWWGWRGHLAHDLMLRGCSVVVPSVSPK